jgi:5-deoxy-glucuronate isomerase
VTDAAYCGTNVQLTLPRLAAGQRAAFTSSPTEEAVLVLLTGDVEWDSTGATRKDVFGARASAVYLPPGTTIDVTAREDTELALVSTVDCALAPAGEPSIVTPDDVVVSVRGKPGWLREVHDVVADNVDAQRLIVGETFNEPGQWSSFPPHKHDGGDGEPALEEVYYYRFDRPDGFGFQGLYELDGAERAVFLRHGAVVGIPSGYHPVCAAPGYRLYYFWALAPRAGTPRALALHEDPAHVWLNGENPPSR